MEYPFYKTRREKLKLPGGRPLEALSLEGVVSGSLRPEEVGIHPETLCAQAAVAESAGFPQLAANLRRAAELTGIPAARILEVYEALRPGRSTAEGLEAMAKELEGAWRAPLTAAFVREAAGAEGLPPPPA